METVLLRTTIHALSNKKTNIQSRTVKPVLSGQSKKRPQMGFQDQLSLNAGQ